MRWFKNLSSESRWLFALVTVHTVVRMVAASFADLGIDEAYYWAWSKHIDLSYFDHPPMVAYLIRCSTFLFGDGTLAVRLPSILLSAGFLVVMFKLSTRLYNTPRVGWLTALFCTLSPITYALGFLMLPDAPLMFFSALVLYVFLDFVGGKQDAWWLGGIMLGCALLSKYNGILLGLSAIAFLATGFPNDRRLLRSWRLAGAAVIAAAVFIPVIVWNAQHQWASFSFQLRHGFGGSQSAWWILVPGSILAQSGYVSPVIWMGSARTLVKSAQNMMRDSRARFIAMFGGIPILFFLVAGFRTPGLPHWAAVGYAVLFIGIAAWCDMNFRAKKIMLWGGVLFGALPLLLLSVHASIGLIGLPYQIRLGDKDIRIRDQTDMIHGWSEWSEVVREMTLPGGQAEGVAAVVTHHWMVGGKALYALKNTGIPVVVWNSVRTTQFDFWSAPEDYIGKDLLFVTTSQMDTAGVYRRADAFYRADAFDELPEVSWPKANMQVTKFKMEIVRGFRGLKQFTRHGTSI